MIKQILKKSFLVIIGLLLSLLILEIFIRTAGFALSSYQTYNNNQSLKNKSQYTVMCIGESTTGGQYPVQLQQILNSKYPGKFSVIDCGVSGINLLRILQSLDDNITKYKPDITICMMGVNDGFVRRNSTDFISQPKQNILDCKIKTYKLYLLLKYSIQEKLAPNNYNLHLKDSVIKSLIRAKIDYTHKQYRKYDGLLLEFLKNDPDNKTAYSSLLNRKDIVEKIAVAARKIKSCHGELYYRILINYNIMHGTDDDVKSLLNRMSSEENLVISLSFYKNIESMLNDEQKKSLFSKTVSKYQVLESIMTFKEKETVFKRVIAEDIDIAYGARGLYYYLSGNYALADDFFNTTEQLRKLFPNEKMHELYKSIVQKLIDKNIKAICMQYPVRQINLLENILKTENYYTKITFISNEENFKRVLKEKKYDEVFCDNFAGDFGHCLNYGNMLIADNVEKTLTDLTKND